MAEGGDRRICSADIVRAASVQLLLDALPSAPRRLVRHLPPGCARRPDQLPGDGHGAYRAAHDPAVAEPLSQSARYARAGRPSYPAARNLRRQVWLADPGVHGLRALPDHAALRALLDPHEYAAARESRGLDQYARQFRGLR